MPGYFEGITFIPTLGSSQVRTSTYQDKFAGKYVTTIVLPKKTGTKLKRYASKLGLSVTAYVRLVLSQSIDKIERIQ